MLNDFVHFATHFQQLVPERIVHRFTVCQAKQAFVPLTGEDVFFTFARQVAPHFISGEGEDWCHPAHQRFCDVIQRSLAATTRHTVRFGGVLTVFDDVEVEGTHLNGAEAHQTLYHFVEIVCFVRVEDVFLCRFRTTYGPAIQYHHLFRFHHIFCWIKTVQVCQQEARGVTDTTIAIGSTFQDLVRNGHFTGVVG